MDVKYFTMASGSRTRLAWLVLALAQVTAGENITVLPTVVPREIPTRLIIDTGSTSSSSSTGGGGGSELAICSIVSLDNAFVGSA